VTGVHAGAAGATSAPLARSSIPIIRHWTLDRGRALGAGPTSLSSIELVVSEVVTNAVVHAPMTAVLVARFRLLDGAVVRFEVQDDAPAAPWLRARDADRPGGLGMHIVSALTTAWGCIPTLAQGKVVWFTIAL
jgi:anti-sigma regulatory factor (Ser/Thr protein kinase)